MNNNDYIDSYKDEKQILSDYYKFRDKNGVVKELVGIINPLKIDNRQLFAPIDNQGNAPHCAGYSAASIVESLYWKHTGKLLQLDSHQVYAAAKLADGEIYQEGTYLEHALNAVIDLCKSRDDFDFMKDAKVGLCYSDGGQNTVNTVKFLVHKFGIIQAGFAIDEGWYDVTNANYKIRPRGRELGGHAVNICGYNSEGFYIANQWSTSFGAKGFAIMDYGTFLKQFMYGAYIYGVTC